MKSVMSRQWRLVAAAAIFCVGLIPVTAMATFSIVAVDTVTGDIGGAGASCISGSKIINDIIEGIGAVHTQAYYIPENQANAHARLAEGLTPDSIVQWLEANDVEGMPEIRQYGVVTLAGQGSSAGFTGWGTTYWAGHLTGPGYAIQGNILLGPEILTAMESAYLNTPGPLEDRLMAALEAADVPGADTRCTSCNKPAISAFIKVIHTGDGGTPFLYKYVDNTICEVDPIPRLRLLYDDWKRLQYPDPDSSMITVDPMILPANGTALATVVVTPRNYLNQPPTAGSTVAMSNAGAGTLSGVTDNGDGTFSATLTAPTLPGSDAISAVVTAGGQQAELTQKPVVRYILCGDANGDMANNLSDAVFLVNYVFKGGPAPSPSCMGDTNTDGAINLADAVFMINYVFKGGPAPSDQCCLPLW